MDQLVSHHLDSYEKIIRHDFPDLINREKPLNVKKYNVVFGPLYYEMPRREPSGQPLLPAEARRRDLTYQASACCRLTVRDPQGRETRYPRLELCKLPVMLGSSLCWTKDLKPSPGECPRDPGGYFIIKGKERVIIPHVRPAYEQPTVYVQEGPIWLCEFRSVNPCTQQSVMVQARTDGRRILEFSLPYIKQYVPAGLVFKAMGIEATAAAEICGLGKVVDNLLVCSTSVHEAMGALLMEQHVNGPADALSTLAYYMPDSRKDGNKREYVESVLSKELFLHGGDGATHLGWMVRKLAQVACGLCHPTDRNDLSNKRVDTSGNLILFLLDGLLKQYIRLFLNSAECQKNLCPYTVLQNSQIITNGLHLCFATGNWTIKRMCPSAYVRLGVSQILSNHNYGAKISHLRRLMHSVSFKGKNIKMRQLHASHYGFLCPYETPEGERVGIVLNLAEGASISNKVSRDEILQSLDSDFNNLLIFGPSHVAWFNSSKCATISVDGRLIGYTSDPTLFVNFARLKLCNEIGISWDKPEAEIHLWGCEGRFIRRMLDPSFHRGVMCTSTPMTLNVKTKIITDKALIQHIFSISHLEPKILKSLHEISFKIQDDQETICEIPIVPPLRLCSQELNYCFIGEDYIDPPASEILTDVLSAVIPFYEHTQSPRNAYQSNMGKQAVGVPTLNFQDRYDATLHRLDYPQKALTVSRAVERVGFDLMAHGALPIVAIMTAEGFNQEDSVVLNASSLDRGLFTSLTYRTLSCHDKRRNKHDSEQICLPDYTVRNRDWDYGLLDEQGVINIDIAKKYLNKNKYIVKNLYKNQERIMTGGEPASYCNAVWLPANTVLVGKVAYRQATGGAVCKDASLVVKPAEEGYLDCVVKEMDLEGKRLVKIRLRTPRLPEMGDKFASFTAQKGTCGAVRRQEDMPFDKDGIVPDLIINPHAFPSRMTVNYLLQMCFDLAACKLGKTYDATAFEHPNLEKEIEEAAKQMGIECWDSVLYSGATGKRLPAKIFMGPCPYQRLRHMVSGKIHSRVSGPVDALTRQPVAGRSRDGGIKVGEMEQWCKISHGAAASLKESMFDTSDKYAVPVCQTCGRISDHFEYCRLCDDVKIRLTHLPYTTKLLFQELQAIGITISFET